MVKMAENMTSIPEIVIPKVYKQLSTHRVLTQEKLVGLRVNDIKALDAAGIDRRQIVAVGARSFFKSVMIDGLFHGDLHGGNLFILPGNRFGIIDFGIVGRLSEKSRDQLASMMMSLLAEDYENLCYEYAELGAAGGTIDFDNFQREVRNTLSPYMGLPLNEMNIGRVLVEATKIATHYDIKIPGDWMLVFKAILTVESMGRILDPQFDLLSAGRELARDLVKNQYSWQRISRDLMWIGKDMASLLQVLPRQLRWMLRKFSSNDFAIEVKSPAFEEMRKQLDLNGRRTSLSILGAGLFIASSLALQHATGHKLWDYPILAVIYFGAGCFVLFTLFIRSFK
jgi:ubiquinone biosynthesis protein